MRFVLDTGVKNDYDCIMNSGKGIKKGEQVVTATNSPVNRGARIGDAEWGLHPFLRGSIPLRSTNNYNRLSGVSQ